MRPLARRVLLFAAVSAIAGAGGYFTAQQMRATRLTEAPAGTPVVFALPDVDGRTRSLSEWKGRLVLVNFWATWCPPCREEIPLFVEAQRRHGAAGLQVVGIAFDAAAEVATYAHGKNINYPLLIGGEQFLKIMGQYGNRSGSLPYSVLLDRDGKVVAQKLGAYKHGDLEELLRKHLTSVNLPSSASN